MSDKYKVVINGKIYSLNALTRGDDDREKELYDFKHNNNFNFKGQSYSEVWDQSEFIKYRKSFGPYQVPPRFCGYNNVKYGHKNQDCVGWNVGINYDNGMAWNGWSENNDTSVMKDFHNKLTNYKGSEIDRFKSGFPFIYGDESEGKNKGIKDLSNFFYANFDTFTSSGSKTLEPWVKSIICVCVGAGGGGGGARFGDNDGHTGAGGGSGGIQVGEIHGFTPGSTVTINIGVHGKGASYNNDGQNGGNTSVIMNNMQVIADGGKGGKRNAGDGGKGGGGSVTGIDNNSNIATLKGNSGMHGRNHDDDDDNMGSDTWRGTHVPGGTSVHYNLWRDGGGNGAGNGGWGAPFGDDDDYDGPDRAGNGNNGWARIFYLPEDPNI